MAEALQKKRDRDQRDRERNTDRHIPELPGGYDDDIDPPRRRKKPKQPKTPQRPTTTPGGDLLCIGTESRMALPTITNEEEKPCAAGLRWGKWCVIHAEGKCKRSHVPINDLTPASQQEWKDHVRRTDDLFFNSETVTCFPASESDLFAKPHDKFLRSPKQSRRG